MNIDHAKAIPVAEILKRLDHHPRRTSNGKLLYLSPIRKEKTPSCWVYTRTNSWHDYGIGQSGDAVDLICAYLKYAKEDHTIPDALRWLTNIMGRRYKFAPVHASEPAIIEEPGLILKKANIIQHQGLIGYAHYIADRQLAHAPKSSTDRAYDRARFLPQRTLMMQQYADYLDLVYLQTIAKSSSGPVML